MWFCTDQQLDFMLGFGSLYEPSHQWYFQTAGLSFNKLCILNKSAPVLLAQNVAESKVDPDACIPPNKMQISWPQADRS